MNFDKNDPRISAYILNELDPAERAEFEQQLAVNTELAAFVAALKQTGTTLSTDLQREARDMSLSAAQRAKILRPHAANGESIWQRFNSWLATPKLMVSAATVISVLLVALFISVLFKQPQKKLTGEQIATLSKADMNYFEPSLAAATPPPMIDPTDAILEPQVEMDANNAPFAGDKLKAASVISSPAVTGGEKFGVSTGIGGGVYKNDSELTYSSDGSMPSVPAAATSRGAAPARVDALSAGSKLDVGTLSTGYINYGGDATVTEEVPVLGSIPVMGRAFRRESERGFAGRNIIAADVRKKSADTWSDRDRDRRDILNEFYLQKQENTWLLAAQEPLSTFSIDVDTASYSNVRRFLANGQLPPPDAVRIEELLNYFTYDYPQPDGKEPFSVTTELAGCPWDANHQLLRIGIKGKEISDKERPRLSLVFLIDVSGSMESDNKLPLVISGLNLLLKKLRPDDRVAIVTYAGNERLALPSTPVREREKIEAVINSLTAAGSTNGEGGIKKAYQVARENFIEKGANRVILCTDGDFNVGNTGEESLAAMVQRQAKSGVFLNVYGFGMGNYKDSRLVQLADQGNGVYGYIDSYAEAQKIFSKQILGTLITIAKDVKIQVDFNPAKVGAYRLIGYEKRMLAKEDFKDDKKDAGEIGSGHTVTALYEVVPPGAAISGRVDPSKYTKTPELAKPALSDAANSEELATVRLRYKLPKENESKPFNVTVSDRELDYKKASVDFKLAAAVAAFGMTLKDSPERGDADLALALQLAKMGKGEDKDNYRAEFIRLVETAKELQP